jgi:hypothetical protein
MIDDASWHYEAKDFPADLPPAAGATHIGMFFTWLALHNLASVECELDHKERLAALRERQHSPGDFVWSYLDGKLSEFDLSARGLAFARWCYQGGGHTYLAGYEEMAKPSGRSEYYLPDTWQTYEVVASLIEARYAEWLRVSTE